MVTKVDFGCTEYAGGSLAKGWYQYGVHGTEVCGSRKTGLFIKGEKCPTRREAIASAKAAAEAYKQSNEG